MPLNGNEASPSATLSSLHHRLSPKTIEQIHLLQGMNPSQVDISSWDDEYAEALQELEAIETVTASLFKIVVQLRRQQAVCDGRVLQLEDEIKHVDGCLEDHLLPAKTSYQHAEAALRKGSQAMEKFKTYCTERLDDLQSSSKKFQCNVVILQSQWSAVKAGLEELQTRLYPVEERTESLVEQSYEV
ncbi:hypothetical protein BV20DRAFT_1057370 [Pilatotrama ljubarskyi]|nr:hypothetical protein BV20DRAFT_1057370 [Pilatotrama ljubarskyi]